MNSIKMNSNNAIIKYFFKSKIEVNMLEIFCFAMFFHPGFLSRLRNSLESRTMSEHKSKIMTYIRAFSFAVKDRARNALAA